MNAVAAIEKFIKNTSIESIDLNAVTELADQNGERMSPDSALNQAVAWGDIAREISEANFKLGNEIEVRDMDNDPLHASWVKFSQQAIWADVRRHYYSRIHTINSGYVD